MTVKLISESRKDLLRLLLKDPRISQEILVNGEIPQSIVIHDDGSVTFGRTPRKWWNWIFQDKTHKEFAILAFDMRRAFAKYTPKNSMFAQFMKDEIISSAIDSRDYDLVIDRFVMNAFLGVTEGDYLLKNIKEDKRPRQPQKKDTDGYRTVGSTTLTVKVGDGFFGDIPLIIQERE